jgi:chromosome segregation ATPase
MSEHTIDHLCPPHKRKVVELLKQLLELRKRCSILENELEAAGTEENRLNQISANLTHQIEAEEVRLLEATRLSAAAREQLQKLTADYERESKQAVLLRVKASESRDEVAALNTTYQQLRVKYDKHYRDTGETFRAETAEVETQTKERHFANQECEAPPPETRSEMFFFEDRVSTPLHLSLTDELDDETHSLILMLNTHY